jgi:hypothetical protein
VDAVIYNLRTHRLLGPTNVGFCGEGGGSGVRGYSAVPATVLTGFGLHPCVAPSTSTNPLAKIVGTWGAHEVSLVINSAGTGHMKYADLTACPTCSFGTAPVGTLTFVLSTVTSKPAKGTVTASSDLKNYTVGEPVVVTPAAGSPGQLLHVGIGARSLIFCNQTSAGQCGA